jgi:hypothetical protein
MNLAYSMAVKRSFWVVHHWDIGMLNWLPSLDAVPPVLVGSSPTTI